MSILIELPSSQDNKGKPQIVQCGVVLEIQQVQIDMCCKSEIHPGF